jgi:hypothetical protein
MKRYLVMNIGCIECGVSSKVVGVFSKHEVADEWAAKLDKTHYWRGGGQNDFEVFELPPMDAVDAEYMVPCE